MDWFLYDNVPRHERVKHRSIQKITIDIFKPDIQLFHDGGPYI